MPYIPPAQRKIAAAAALLANPGTFDNNLVFADVPREGWAKHGYQFTLTVQWSNVPVTDSTPITVRAHVHYQWKDNAWKKIAGSAWISGVENWSQATPGAVVDKAPALPSDPNYHP